MITTNSIMESILATATHNLEKNAAHIPTYENVCSAGNELAKQYVETFRTAISRDILNVDDMYELGTALQKQILGTTYMLRVCISYLDEVERHKELMLSEYFFELDEQEEEAMNWYFNEREEGE